MIHRGREGAARQCHPLVSSCYSLKRMTVLALDVTTLRGYDVTTQWEATWLMMAFGNLFQTRYMSQWLARLWSMCDDLDICKTRLFRLQDWLLRSWEEVPWTKSSCQISSSSALHCIPVQSSNHSVPTNVGGDNPVANCEGRSGRTERNRKVDRGGWFCRVVAPYPHHPVDLFPRTQCRQISKLLPQNVGLKFVTPCNLLNKY